MWKRCTHVSHPITQTDNSRNHLPDKLLRTFDFRLSSASLWQKSPPFVRRLHRRARKEREWETGDVCCAAITGNVSPEEDISACGTWLLSSGFYQVNVRKGHKILVGLKTPLWILRWKDNTKIFFR
jgi:hypothetical protein